MKLLSFLRRFQMVVVTSGEKKGSWGSPLVQMSGQGRFKDYYDPSQVKKGKA